MLKDNIYIDKSFWFIYHMVFPGLVFSAGEGWQSDSSILVHPWAGGCRVRDVAEPH